MTRPKGRQFWSSTECAARVACDGSFVRPPATVCRKCERAARNRGKAIPPRGLTAQERIR